MAQSYDWAFLIISRQHPAPAFRFYQLEYLYSCRMDLKRFWTPQYSAAFSFSSSHLLVSYSLQITLSIIQRANKYTIFPEKAVDKDATRPLP